MNYTAEKAHIGYQSTTLESNRGEYSMKCMCQWSKQMCLTYLDQLYPIVYNWIPIQEVNGIKIADRTPIARYSE